MHKIGRNDPCPCGSGKKYKHCCLGRDTAAAAVAIAPDGDRIAARYNAAVSLQLQGRLDDAVRAYRDVLGRAPRHADARYNLALALDAQGRPDEAIENYRSVIMLRPTFIEARSNLGWLLHRQGRLDEAVDCYRAALAIKPHAMIYNNLGYVQDELGHIDAAVASYRRALELGDSPDVRVNFARCVKYLEGGQTDANLRALVARAIVEAWTRPSDLATVAINLIKSDPIIGALIDRASHTSSSRPAANASFESNELEAVASDALFVALLENAPVCDVAVERFVTAVRKTMLARAVDADATEPSAPVVACYAAVARQCFLNEYVFACDEDEATRAQDLRRAIADAAARDEPIAALSLIAAAAYAPLGELACAAALRARSWPAAVRAIVGEQIDEPERERRYRSDIAQLTAIDDAVSLRVREQYEQNPYPRWTRVAIATKARRLNAYLRQQFPLAEFEPLANDDAIDVLVAGCGTGQEAIEAVRQVSGARVLAIDLSAASLAYAKRKTIEAGVDHVTYAQADILELSSVRAAFDMVTSVGVLHHLADPIAGWRALLAHLRRGGFMRIGLYSERARRDVVAARDLIAERGYGSTAADIRRARQELIAGGSRVSVLRDFYTTSECRDLLFHVQEHRVTLAAIKQALVALDLRFIGFLLEPHVLRDYRERNPHDRTLTDLDAWDAFEAQFPDTFIGMYRFWVQKPP